MQRVLDHLVEHGLVDRQDAGEARLYTLNRDHVLSPVVEHMASARTELFDRLRQEIASWEVAPVHASLFGSAARGDGGTDSDIDIFVVRPKEIDAEDPRWREQMDRLADAVHRWTGNRAGIAEVSSSDLPRLRKEQPPVIGELKEDAVELAGQSVRALMRARTTVSLASAPHS